jgi:hypothetical protein
MPPASTERAGGGPSHAASVVRTWGGPKDKDTGPLSLWVVRRRLPCSLVACGHPGGVHTLRLVLYISGRQCARRDLACGAAQVVGGACGVRARGWRVAAFRP